MKRSKLLIPTLSALAVTPAIALSACNQGDSVEQQILDCVFKPIKLKKTHVDNFEAAYKEQMTDEEKKQELIYDAFGDFNTITVDDDAESISDLWLNKHEGAFKVNIAEISVVKSSDKYLATLRGYIAYVFGKEHTTLLGSTKVTMKANDFIMITYQFKNIEVKVDGDCFNFGANIESAIVGIAQYKYNGGEDETIVPIPKIDTRDWEVSNSKNWTNQPVI